MCDHQKKKKKKKKQNNMKPSKSKPQPTYCEQLIRISSGYHITITTGSNTDTNEVKHFER
jgi:hypothetical protein